MEEKEKEKIAEKVYIYKRKAKIDGGEGKGVDRGKGIYIYRRQAKRGGEEGKGVDR